jgi:hypothetical protein
MHAPEEKRKDKFGCEFSSSMHHSNETRRKQEATELQMVKTSTEHSSIELHQQKDTVSIKLKGTNAINAGCFRHAAPHS